jgi:ligand-binding sensor domain-containing protein
MLRVIWIGVLALPLTAWASRMPVQMFSVAEGLPRNSASCLTAGQTGVMWICTSEGLTRYDGSGFRVFGKESGLPAAGVASATPARAGGYWLVTRAGICRLEKTARIGELCPVIPGSMLVLTNGTFQPVEIPYPKGFTAHGWGSKQNGFQAHDGEWWFPSGRGLAAFHGLHRRSPAAGTAQSAI